MAKTAKIEVGRALALLFLFPTWRPNIPWGRDTYQTNFAILGCSKIVLFHGQIWRHSICSKRNHNPDLKSRFLWSNHNRWLCILFSHLSSWFCFYLIHMLHAQQIFSCDRPTTSFGFRTKKSWIGTHPEACLPSGKHNTATVEYGPEAGWREGGSQPCISLDSRATRVWNGVYKFRPFLVLKKILNLGFAY